MTEPEIVSLRQDENDAIALGLVRKEEGCFIIAGHGHAASPIFITWRYSRKYNLRVDIPQGNEQQLTLQKVPYQGEIMSDMRVSRENTGLFNVRLSSSQAKQLGTATADPGVIYKAHLGLNGKALLRHQMAGRAYEKGSKIKSSPRIFLEEATLLLTPDERFYDDAIFERRSSNFGNLTTILDGWVKTSLHFKLALILVTATYGGIHLAAWQFEFATVTEKWLWRSSCLYIASFAGPAILVGVLTEKSFS